MKLTKQDILSKLGKLHDEVESFRMECQSNNFLHEYIELFKVQAGIARIWNELSDRSDDIEIESSENRNKDNLDKIFNSKLIKSSTYQFVAEFDGKYQPRIIDYMFKNGNPSWIDANEDYSNGKVFTEQELPKVAKQLERYYAETGGGASDIEIVRDNGDSVYLEEFLQEGSFDKAWEKAVSEDEAWEKEHFWDKED